MTRLYDAPHGQITEFIKNLGVAGLTAEDIRGLNVDKVRLNDWVRSLYEEAPLMEAFGNENGGDINVNDAFAGYQYAYTLNKVYETSCNTLAELADWSELELRGDLKRCGKKTIDQIKTVLKDHGLTLSTHQFDDPSRVRGVLRSRSYRRDQLGDLRLRLLVPHHLLKRNRDTVNLTPFDLTISEVSKMTDEELEVYYQPEAVRRIRNWIKFNVW